MDRYVCKQRHQYGNRNGDRVGVGAAIGAAFGNIPIGIAIGISLGAAIAIPNHSKVLQNITPKAVENLLCLVEDKLLNLKSFEAIANKGVDKMLNSYGFIFIANGADPAVDRFVLDRQGFRSVIVAVPNQSAAEQVAIKLVDDGIQFIELCGIFGPVGTAKVIETTGGKVPVGSVNFGAESIDALAALRTPAT